MESKFIGCYKATTQALWLRNFIKRLKVVGNIYKPVKIYCKSSAIVFLTRNNKNGSQNKHIDIKYLIVRDHIKKKKRTGH